MIIGYGNVGRGVIKPLKNNNFKLVGLISRSPERVKSKFSEVPAVKAGDPAAWTGLRPEVSILCGGFKDDLPKQGSRSTSASSAPLTVLTTAAAFRSISTRWTPPPNG